MIQAFFGMIWTLSVWTFIVIKVAGTSLAAWSWFWLLLPPVPIIGLWVQKVGL